MKEPYLGVKPLRYEKYSPVHVEGESYTLIEYLSYKRKEKKISKKSLSQIIRGNDYWYSQIEMGKNDDHRRKFINRADLTDIISVIIFDARNKYELESLKNNSEKYIDMVLNPVSYDSAPRAKQLYEVINELNKTMSPDYANQRLEDTLVQLNATFRTIFSSSDPIVKDHLLSLMNLMILNLSVEPLISLHYYGLPFSPIFSAKVANADESDKNMQQELLQDLDRLLEKYSKVLSSEDFKSIVYRLSSNLVYCIRAIDDSIIPGLRMTDSTADDSLPE